MKTSEYKRLIEYRVKSINEIMGTDYHAHYAPQYGGWNLFLIDAESGANFRGYIGFDFRKSNACMLDYLDGILAGIHFWRMTK